MTKNKFSYHLVFACLALSTFVRGDSVITLFLREYPLIPQDEFTKKTVKKLQKPGKLARHSLHGRLKKDVNSGIFATYGGYLSSSDDVGQISFPRLHEEPTVYLLVTDKITPDVITENTLHHWNIEIGTPAVMYEMTRKKDPETELFYWETKKVEPPENGIIPLPTILLLAKPENIYVPLGVSIAHNTPNLVLPDIYVKKGIKILPSTLYLLNIRHFYGPIGNLYKPDKTRYSTLLKR